MEIEMRLTRLKDNFNVNFVFTNEVQIRMSRSKQGLKGVTEAQ